MKAKKSHIVMGTVLTFSLILFIFGLWTSLWFGLIWWVGPWNTLLAATTSLVFFAFTARWSLARKEKWVPEDAHRMARGLQQKWGYTLEEGWEIVELMEDILRAEHTLETAMLVVRILLMRTDKARTLAILRNLAGADTQRKAPTEFPKVLTT